MGRGRRASRRAGRVSGPGSRTRRGFRNALLAAPERANPFRTPAGEAAAAAGCVRGAAARKSQERRSGALGPSFRRRVARSPAGAGGGGAARAARAPARGRRAAGGGGGGGRASGWRSAGWLAPIEGARGAEPGTPAAVRCGGAQDGGAGRVAARAAHRRRRAAAWLAAIRASG